MRDIPEQIADRYQIQEKLGEGAFAQTFMAEDTRLGRAVAVKVLRSQFADDPEYAARFEREARSAASVVHPNVVGVFDYGQEASTLYLVMELIQGSDLKAFIRDRAPIDPATTSRMTGEILNGLGAIHDAGIIHRDVKPQNVLIDQDSKAKLADFGIARRLADDGLTGTGIALGTASYMSPEQARGAEVVPASDLYAVGVIMFEMLTGRLPFTGEDPLSVIYQHTSEEPPDPRSVNEAVPAYLAAIVLKAMSKTPEERFASAVDMRAAIENPANGEDLTRPMAVPPTRKHASGARPAPRRRPASTPAPLPARRYLALIPLVLIALIVGAVALAGLLDGNDENATVDPLENQTPTEPAVVTDADDEEAVETTPPPGDDANEEQEATDFDDPGAEEPASDDTGPPDEAPEVPPDDDGPPDDVPTDQSDDTPGNSGDGGQGATRYPVLDAGAVIVRQQNGRLSVVQINPAGGWDHRVEKDDDDEVIVEFMSENREVEFRLKHDNGALEVEFEDLHGLATGGTYLVGYAGEVDVFVENGALVLGDVRPADGWSYDVASNEPDDIEVIFRQGEYEASFEADLVNGGFELTIKAQQLLN